ESRCAAPLTRRANAQVPLVACRAHDDLHVLAERDKVAGQALQRKTLSPDCSVCPRPRPLADLYLKRPTEERADDDDDAEHTSGPRCGATV
ncbi:MAG TPA: hypothetical protein VE268_00905, partial [Herpetosiphonaceae bacterium]|nr:hypothetical protein [Herpetosiphonaceae bacterium]